MPPLLFAYFAYVGLFSPFLALWLAHRGMSIAQIGVLMALPQLLRIVGPPAWGWAAGRAPEHLLLRVAGASSTAAVAALFAVDGFGAIAVALLALFFLTSGIVPIGEAITLRAVDGDAGRYGRVRLWGSVGFVAAVLAAGPVLDRLGMGALPVLMLVAMAAVAVAAWRLPAAARARVPAGASPRLRQRMREPAILAFFASAFLMIFAHAGLYAFYSLHLERHGYSRSLIGAMWAIGVLAEIALFFWQKPLFARVSPLALLSASFLVCAARFGAIAWAAGALLPLALAQLAHAVTYGVHHSASMALLHRWFPGPAQARAQAAYVAIGYGMGGASGGLAASWAWDRAGPEAVFMLGALAALVGWGAVAACRRLDYARRTPVEPDARAP